MLARLRMSATCAALLLGGCSLVDLDGLGPGASGGGGGSGSTSPPASSGVGAASSSSGASGGGGASSGCEPGLADCDGEADNGCEAVLATDHANCGMCGRDCGDGDCVAGACPPLLLAGAQAGPSDIAYRDGDVHWVNFETGALMRCAATGCGGSPLQLGISEYWSFYLDLDDTHVYWNHNGAGAVVGGMWRCPRAGGCPPTASPWIADVSNPTEVGVGPAHVYWHTNDGNIQRAAKEDGAVETVLTGVGDSGDVQPDGDELFWTERSQDRVRGCLLAGAACGSETLNVSGAWKAPDNLAVDSTHVYFATTGGTGDVVARVERASGNLETLVSGTVATAGLALSPTHVYFTQASSGTLQKVPKGGGSVQTVAGGVGGIHRVAVGGGFAFVTTGDRGKSVWRFSW